MEFKPFPKLPRLARKCIISEKIDGTNASVAIASVTAPEIAGTLQLNSCVTVIGDLAIWAGARTRWVVPEGVGPKGCDNFGFAAWVRDNAECLLELGPGHHFGEWWGKGIQRNYGIDEKRFSLFNAERWQSARPACVSCVPVLYRGPFSTEVIEDSLVSLAENGSRAAPGFMKPEGIVVFHAASNSMFKKTIDKDEEPKGLKAAA